MNGYVKILIFNLFLVVFLFLMTDYILFAFENYKIYPVDKEFTLGVTDRFEQNLPFDEEKPSVVTVGCSYTYGTSVEQEETFAYKLQEYTKRKVYNYGQPGTGVQHVLYKIENSELFNDKNFNPEYVIYIFISDHLQRLYYDYNPDSQYKYLKYKVKRTGINKYDLVAKYPLPDRLTLFDYIKKSNIAIRIRAFRYKHENMDKQFDLLKLHLIKSKEVLKSKYKDAKFVVVVYNDKCDCMRESVKFLDTDRWSELEDKDFIVINLNKPEFDYLNKDEYMAIDTIHPSGKAWEKLVPVISERLNLK